MQTTRTTFGSILLLNAFITSAWMFFKPAATHGQSHASEGAAEQGDGSNGSNTLFPSHKPPGHSFPWEVHRRIGVMVQSSEQQPQSQGALSPRELRRLGLRPKHAYQVPPEQWQEEPPKPRSIDRQDFASAVRQLCPLWISAEDSEKIASAALRYATHFNVDPTLLVAFVYHQSRCQVREENSYGRGLAMLNVGQHQNKIRQGHYLYRTRKGNRWEVQKTSVKKYPFVRETLLQIDGNLYFAAAILSSYQQQCPSIDRVFLSHKHRSPISHLIWGEQVKNAAPEQGVLRARRRLIEYYEHQHERRGLHSLPHTTIMAVRITSPLDGAPLIVSGRFGDDREQGKRKHKGVDFLSDYGEPVRTVAAGVVVEAGAELRNGELVNLPNEAAQSIPRPQFGARGLFVTVQHKNGLRTIYAHLLAYRIQVGDLVKAGQQIGRVGRTGIRESDPHLHFGIFHKEQDGIERALDPAAHLGQLIYLPPVHKKAKHDTHPRQANQSSF